MSEHRWSGWPGAWCLDCGCDDPMEVALADGWDMEGPVPEKYRIGPCKEPGSRRHDPYDRAALSEERAGE